MKTSAILNNEKQTNFIDLDNIEINKRWNNIKRLYFPEDVHKLRGTINIEYSLARQGAEKLWKYLNEDDFVGTFGVLTGKQAVQHAKAGLKAVYVSGWQVAADANTSGNTYPDQSLYPVDSVPTLVKRINSALLRIDQVETLERFENKSRLIEYITDNYPGCPGLGSRTLAGKLSDACNSLDQYLTDRK